MEHTWFCCPEQGRYFIVTFVSKLVYAFYSLYILETDKVEYSQNKSQS